MKVTNALVTYDEVATMGLLQQPSVNPPTGNQICTKNYITTYYHASSSALSSYASNQCPPYQDIVPDPNPFLLCYSLDIVTTYPPGCGSYSDELETWTISLVDQFGNAYITPTNLTFQVQYDYYWQDDVPPYTESSTQTINMVVLAGSYQTSYGFYRHSYFNCSMSSTCDGSCYSTISNINLISSPSGIGGGCSTPPPPPPGPCAYTQILFPQGFSPNGDGVNDVWRFEGKRGGVWEVLNYSCFPNTTWDIFDATGVTKYSGTSTTYVPWNGKINNTGADVPDGGYYYNVDLGDGAGVRKGFVIIAR